MTENPWVIGAIAGIPGGIVAMLFLQVMISKTWSTQRDAGLTYPRWLVCILFACFLLAPLTVLGLVFGAIVYESPWEFWVGIAFFVLFGIGVLCLVVEVLGIRGHYNETGISMKSPWTGEKKAQWVNLEEVILDRRWGNYVLHFKDGKKIQLSVGLSGVSGLVETLGRRGFDVEPFY